MSMGFRFNHINGQYHLAFVSISTLTNDLR